MNFEELLQSLKRNITENSGETSGIDLPPDAFVISDEEGRTLLMRAAADGDPEVVRSLVAVSSIGGDFDATDYHGMTALLHAAAGESESGDSQGKETEDLRAERQKLSHAYRKSFSEEPYFDLNT